MTEKRMKDVDVDNLTKAVLDCLIGLVFEDDSQVINVLAKKFVHPLEQRNSVLKGVRRIKGEEDSWFRDIRLFRFEYRDTEDSNEPSH